MDKIQTDLTLNGLMLVIGLVLSYYAFKIMDKLDSPSDTQTCDEHAKKAGRGLLIMGVSITMISLTLMAAGGCPSVGSRVGKKAVEMAEEPMAVLVLLALISITTLVLSSIIRSKCSDVKNESNVVLGLSTLGTLISLGLIGYDFKNKR